MAIRKRKTEALAQSFLEENGISSLKIFSPSEVIENAVYMQVDARLRE